MTILYHDSGSASQILNNNFNTLCNKINLFIMIILKKNKIYIKMKIYVMNTKNIQTKKTNIDTLKIGIAIKHIWMKPVQILD